MFRVPVSPRRTTTNRKRLVPALSLSAIENDKKHEIQSKWKMNSKSDTKNSNKIRSTNSVACALTPPVHFHSLRAERDETTRRRRRFAGEISEFSLNGTLLMTPQTLLPCPQTFPILIQLVSPGTPIRVSAAETRIEVLNGVWSVAQLMAMADASMSEECKHIFRLTDAAYLGFVCCIKASIIEVSRPLSPSDRRGFQFNAIPNCCIKNANICRVWGATKKCRSRELPEA